MSCSSFNTLQDSGSGHRNNTTALENSPADGAISCLLSPHWIVTVFCVIGYILCFFLGAASATSSVYRMMSHKDLRRSHWSTIVLLAISVFVNVIVVPLELTRTSMHFFNTMSVAVCDVQLFCVILSEVLAYSNTVAIAISRVRKIHSPFQPRLQDLPERIAVSLCLIISIPLAAFLSYLSHVDSDIYFIYQYCLMASSKKSSQVLVELRTFLNMLLPVSFFVALAALICVYMKGLLHFRNRTSIYPGSLQCSSVSMLTASRRNSKDRITDSAFQQPCRPTTTNTFLTMVKSSGDGHGSSMFLTPSESLSTADYRLSTSSSISSSSNPCKSSTFRMSGYGNGTWKNSAFLTPRESLSSTDYHLSSITTSGSPCSSGAQSTSPHQQFSLTEPLPKSSDASEKHFTDCQKDSVSSRSALRKARKTQYSISKALRKVSAVSMLSIDTIPEMSMFEEQPKLLHPLRHTRRSASNMWHSADTDSTPETTMHQSGQFKRKCSKTRKSKSQQSGCSIASSTGSNPQAHSDSIDPVMSCHPLMLQKHKRKMSQNSRASMMSGSTHISTATNEDLEAHIELDSFDTESLNNTVSLKDKGAEQINEEPPEPSGKKTDGKKPTRLFSPSLPKLSQGSQLSVTPLSPQELLAQAPSFDLDTNTLGHLATAESSHEKNRTGNISPVLSLADSVINRPPLPPIPGTSKPQEVSQKEHFRLPILQTLDNEQLPMQSFIQTWGRCPPSRHLLQRSRSLINFYSTNHPAVYDDFEEAPATQPASEPRPYPEKTYTNRTTQTDEIVCEGTSDNVVGVQAQPDADRDEQKQHHPQQPQKPLIRIIRPSLPHKQSQALDSRRILRNNWCSNDQLESMSSSVQFMASPSVSRDSKKWDRSSSLLHRNSVWSEKSITMNRNDKNLSHMLKRSLLLIAAFLLCFLPLATVSLSASLLDSVALANLYALSRMSECIYFMLVPFLYFYTNSSLMKFINRRPHRNVRH